MVFVLDLHTSVPLPIPPLQYKIWLLRFLILRFLLHRLHNRKKKGKRIRTQYIRPLNISVRSEKREEIAAKTTNLKIYSLGPINEIFQAFTKSPNRPRDDQECSGKKMSLQSIDWSAESKSGNCSANHTDFSHEPDRAHPFERR